MYEWIVTAWHAGHVSDYGVHGPCGHATSNERGWYVTVAGTEHCWADGVAARLGIAELDVRETVAA